MPPFLAGRVSTQQKHHRRKYYSRVFLASDYGAVSWKRVKIPDVWHTPLSPRHGNQRQLTCGQRLTALCNTNTILFYLNLSLFLKLALHNKLCVLQQADFRLLLILSDILICIFLLKNFYSMPSFSSKSVFSYSGGLPLNKSLAKLTVNITEEGKAALRVSWSYAAKRTHVNKLTITQYTNGMKHAHRGSLEAPPAY